METIAMTGFFTILAFSVLMAFVSLAYVGVLVMQGICDEVWHRWQRWSQNWYLSKQDLLGICYQISLNGYENEWKRKQGYEGEGFDRIMVSRLVFWKIMDETWRDGITKSEWESILEDDERRFLYGFVLRTDTDLTDDEWRELTYRAFKFKPQYTGVVGKEVNTDNEIQLRWKDLLQSVSS